MANQEHLNILTQGVERWNQWRNEQPDILPDLSMIDLSRLHLIGFDFTGANFTGAKLVDTNFYGTKLASIGKVFKGSLVKLTVDFVEADLTRASLSDNDLSQADFTEANLESANLADSRLLYANLSMANLNNAFLYRTNFNGAKLNETSFHNARMMNAIFGDVDLSRAKGLETVRNEGPSTIGIDTLHRSNGNISEVFLRGVGFTETQISLLTPRPIEYASLFISYAHQDNAIAKRLYIDLCKKDVPCWFAPHDLRPGTPILRGIEQAIDLQDKFLLILSNHAVKSAWIEREVDAALHQEIKRGQDVLFPIRLDNAVLESSAGWATRLQHRHIGDFTGWQEDRAYQEAFTTLLRHLKANQRPAL